MYKIIIFGGTTEGRKLCEYCSEHAISILYCTATADGARQVEGLSYIHVQYKRMDTAEMTALLKTSRPALVVDATHPYAKEASSNIAAACTQNDIELIRVMRDGGDAGEGVFFPDIDRLMSWLAQTRGNIFAATGISAAKAFSCLPDYQMRVWLRILPNIDSLCTALDLGYRADRLICMQGPFSEEINRAMFKAANAEILVTKDSGTAGGFEEKIRAAQSLGMKIAVLSRPEEAGLTLSEAFERIKRL